MQRDILQALLPLLGTDHDLLYRALRQGLPADEIRDKAQAGQHQPDPAALVKEVSVNIGGYGAVTYQTADAPKLEKHFAHLKLEIRRKQGGSGRKAIYVEL